MHGEDRGDEPPDLDEHDGERSALDPIGLGGRGTALWEALTRAAVPDAGARVLIVEACRAADRLERLDELLRGDVQSWARVELPTGDGDELVLRVNPLLGEARQQQTVLRGLLHQLRGDDRAHPHDQPKGSLVDDLAARRVERQSAAAAE